MFLRPKKWETFQHYKDRAPSWVKLHKSLLDDFEFQSLPVASRALAPMLWLIASEGENGTFDANPTKLAFRMRMSVTDVEAAIKPLVEKAFFEVVRDDSKTLAGPERSSSPEKKEQVQTEKEKILPASAGASEPSVSKEGKKKFVYPEDFEAFWGAYPTDQNMPKKPAFKQWLKLALEKRLDAASAIPAFKRYCEENRQWYRPIYAERFLSQEKFAGFLGKQSFGVADPELLRIQELERQAQGKILQ